MKHLLGTLLLTALVGAGCAPAAPNATPGNQEPQTAPQASLQEVLVNEGQARGLYIAPQNQNDLPGVVVVHEWWGLNEQVKDEARKLAREGYAVFAIDLYDGVVGKDSAEAGKLAGAARANPDAQVAKMKAALDYLAARPEVADEKLASLGWCFGGGMTANLATSDPRLKATVIYYGTPVTDAAKLANIQHPVLGVWGKEDQSIPVKDVEAFEQKLKDQKTSVEFHYYDGAGHAFANPTRGDAYRPEATADAWAKTLGFLNRNLK